MRKALPYLCCAAVAISMQLYAKEQQSPLVNAKQAKRLQQLAKSTTGDKKTTFQSFTGKIVGNHVRMRTDADVDCSNIVRELEKGELLVVKDEYSDFYIVEPPSDTKAYIFRSFVLDGVVEGSRVNVRLAPDLDAPVIAHVGTGEKIDGTISEKNTKWLEIAPPKSAKFFIAKEFIDFVGGPEVKPIHDRKLAQVKQLMESADLLRESEFRKPFQEIDYNRLAHNYQLIMEDFKEFSNYVEKAKAELDNMHESYLKMKLAYLENKANMLDRSVHTVSTVQESTNESSFSPTDRMKIWEPVERGLYLTWSAMHSSKTMKDYYEDQQASSSIVTGILETFQDPIKNKPGDFIIRERDVPVAYVYSTHVNLHEYVGKQVQLVVTTRPNNNFAWPAYYVLDVEQ